MVVIAEGTRRLLGNLFELRGPRAEGPQGHRRAGAGLGGAAGEFGGKPLRGAARRRPDRAGRAGRRTRTAAAALVEGKERRRPGGAALRRGRHRQIAADGGAPGTPRRRAAHAPALFLLAAAHRQRALSDHRPDGTRRRICARRHAANEARQARCAAGADFDLDRRTRRCSPRCCRCRTTDAIPRSIWPRSSAGRRTLEALDSQVEALARSSPVLMIFEDAHWTDPTSLEAFGRTVDRIATLPRAADRDVPARVRAALDRTAARDSPDAQPAGAARSRRHDRPRRRQQAAAGEHPAGHHRAHRRHSPVRGGDDQGGAGGGERGRGASRLPPRFRLRRWRSPQACTPR